MPPKAHPVDLRGLMLRPLPGEMLNKVACVNCRENPARWEFITGGDTALDYACSFCLLYQVGVLKEQREAVDWVAHEVEKLMGVVFPRTPEGRLLREQDADRIAFGIVAGNKTFTLQMRLAQKGTQ